MRIGLTGGMGSGKSTVARMLADHGFVVFDADRIAREVVEPGEPALDAIAERFGDEVVGPDGTLDRPALAAVVFHDEDARADLEAITHPAIHDEILRRESAVLEDDPHAVVVVDHPLLIETGRVDDFDGLVVVLADREVRLDRLAEHRGIDREDAAARMAAQADDEARRTAATWVIDNDGDLDALQVRVDEVAAAIRADASRAGDSRASVT